MTDCPFCAIVAGEAAAVTVFRSTEAVAFLDRSPVFFGHALVVPCEHYATLADMPTDRLGAYFGVVQRIAAVLPAALGCEGTWVSINNGVSQSVPHLHVHIVPRRRKDGLRGFYWPRVRYGSQEEMNEVAERIIGMLDDPKRG